MPKKKQVNLPPWATAVPKGQKGEWFIQCSYSLFKSPAFQALSNGSKVVYLIMMFARTDGKMNRSDGTFIFPKRYYTSWGLEHKAVLRAVAELSKAGFIEIVSNGRTRRIDSVYRFTNKWKENKYWLT